MKPFQLGSGTSKKLLWEHGQIQHKLSWMVRMDRKSPMPRENLMKYSSRKWKNPSKVPEPHWEFLQSCSLQSPCSPFPLVHTSCKRRLVTAFANHLLAIFLQNFTVSDSLHELGRWQLSLIMHWQSTFPSTQHLLSSRYHVKDYWLWVKKYNFQKKKEIPALKKFSLGGRNWQVNNCKTRW